MLFRQKNKNNTGDDFKRQGNTLKGSDIKMRKDGHMKDTRKITN